MPRFLVPAAASWHVLDAIGSVSIVVFDQMQPMQLRGFL